MKKLTLLLVSVFIVASAGILFALPPSAGPAGSGQPTDMTIINATYSGNITPNNSTGFLGSPQTKGGLKVQGLAATSAPTATPVGTTGATTYDYCVDAISSTGTTACSALGSTATGNATLSGTNYNRVTWARVPGAQGYHLWRTTGGVTRYITLGNVNTYNDVLKTTGTVGVAPVVDTSAQMTAAGPLDLGTNDLTCNQATMTVNSIGTTSTTHDDSRNGLMLVNTTSTATGTTTQVSPALQFTAHALDSDASDPDKDDTHDWKISVVPSTAATTTSQLTFQAAVKRGTAAWGAYTAHMTLQNNGALSIPNSSITTGSYMQASSYYTTTDGIYVGNSASFGGPSVTIVKTKLTTDATVFHIWTATALAAESCVNVRASCSVIDKAATASHNSYDKETLCCNAAGTTTCDAITAIREVEVEAAWDMTILPCDAVAGSCLVADAPVVAITGEAAHNLNWKCSVVSYVLTNG